MQSSRIITHRNFNCVDILYGFSMQLFQLYNVTYYNLISNWLREFYTVLFIQLYLLAKIRDQ